LKARLETLENTTLQSRVDQMQVSGPGGEKTLKSLIQDGQSQFRLADHVIPLTALKKRVEGAEIATEANAAGVDGLNARLTETTKVLMETLERELAKMVTKDEFKVLEDKHNALEAKVDKMIKDLVERLEKLIKDLQVQVDTLALRVDGCEEKLDSIVKGLDEVKEAVEVTKQRLDPLEEIMPTKADRTELESAIQEIRDELEALNIEEIMAMAEKANERLDSMDERCDGIEDDTRDLREHVLRKEKEMEDLQLEKQIEQLRRDLEEAKKGVFAKATERMDQMQQETDAMKDTIRDTQGSVQLNRENIEALGDAMQESGARVTMAKKQPKEKNDAAAATSELVAKLQEDVASLQQRYVEAAAKEAAGVENAEKTDMLVREIQTKMTEIDSAKADRQMVVSALRVKADKEAVARDTEANQRAVDMALSTMNAGTQGIQQMLEKQEGQVSGLSRTVASKLDREEISLIESRLAETLAMSGGGGGGGGGGGSNRIDEHGREHTHDLGEAKYGGYGVSAGNAAAMARKLDHYNCIACQRPIDTNSSSGQLPLPALPLLPSAQHKVMSTTVAYVPQRRPSYSADYPRPDDSIVEIQDLRSPRRATGGSHTTTRKSLGPDPRRVQSARGVRTPSGPSRPSELMGEDGRIYQGRSGSTRPQSSRHPRGPSPAARI
jgi:centrosome and spindle pole-associated protein 1